MTETSTKKKRVAIHKKDGLTIRMDYGYITEEEFETSLKEYAQKAVCKVEDILTYTLGDEEADMEGTVYFCPKCGSYEEYGYEPETRLYYQENKETGTYEEVGYYKRLTIDCHHCNEVYDLTSEKMEEESRKLTKLFQESKQGE